jgi:hypothetical protein
MKNREMKQTIVALSEYQQAASSCHTTPLSTHVITQYRQTLSDQISREFDCQMGFRGVRL